MPPVKFLRKLKEKEAEKAGWIGESDSYYLVIDAEDPLKTFGLYPNNAAAQRFVKKHVGRRRYKIIKVWVLQ